MGKEDNRDVTREKGIRKEKKLLSWAEWGSEESRGAQECCDLAKEGV